jgi:tetratricopeptide (TPR) repeat protein
MLLTELAPLVNAQQGTIYHVNAADYEMQLKLLSSYAQTKSQRGTTRAAEEAFRRAIAENPKDPLLRINHAIVLMDENRLGESKSEIDAALAIDPTLATAQVVRARYALQMGDAEAALPDALAGSAADPGGADSLLVLALLYYRRGDYGAALQQIDAADRLDPVGPAAPLIRAAVALDRMDIDSAIGAAREAQRRSVARGGDSEPSQSSSTADIPPPARAIGLDDWGCFTEMAVRAVHLDRLFRQIARHIQSLPIDQRLDAFDPSMPERPCHVQLMQGWRSSHWQSPAQPDIYAVSRAVRRSFVRRRSVRK